MTRLRWTDDQIELHSPESGSFRLPEGARIALERVDGRTVAHLSLPVSADVDAAAVVAAVDGGGASLVRSFLASIDPVELQAAMVGGGMGESMAAKALAYLARAAS